MLSKEIYRDNQHTWYVFGRDPDKPDGIIDTNQYMISCGDQALLMDPGGIELFASMLASIVKHIPVDQITHLFASHQDPDIISSLGLWDRTLSKASLHASGLWEGFIRHFGMDNIEYQAIADEGGSLSLGACSVEFIPAHYLHSSANFHVYDAQAKILMSGDIGAALEAPGAAMEIEDFEAHTHKMRYFHQRWMPSNKAKDRWIDRISKLDIDMMCPQHGRIFRGDDVKRFLDWFSKLEVGIAAQ
ncbi:MBL fold metallo-hydrolase [Agaribacterium haliotis]|uniref:MBL fold metallo-hydrolase n=1 Tax=Agaribacterium haliotis TaxID=2013869 RepID=UPI000BB54F28|nr:MBL fold metallo-hydrolase [Agaribacterium haliotis]